MVVVTAAAAAAAVGLVETAFGARPLQAPPRPLHRAGKKP
jgi:hypothetical protein